MFLETEAPAAARYTMAPRGRKCALVDTLAGTSHLFATKGKRLEWIRENLNEKYPGEFTSDGTVNAYLSQWLNSAESKAKGPLWEKFAEFMEHKEQLPWHDLSLQLLARIQVS